MRFVFFDVHFILYNSIVSVLNVAARYSVVCKQLFGSLIH